MVGHCFEAGTGNPPRGLQLTLGSKSNPNYTDTIVMANLGYLQLKVSFGKWNIFPMSTVETGFEIRVTDPHADSDPSLRKCVFFLFNRLIV
jgi:UDP-glucose:glycoprotein glucosyltransferase